MNSYLSPSIKKSRYPRIYLSIFYIFAVSFLIVSSAVANTDGTVTFSWQANPTKDYVIGYRLYYGSGSRFNSNGTLKSNFSYDHYIDYSELKRCDIYSSGTSCEILSPKELQCENLYQSSPKCTVFNLRGPLYFAMTAYNAQAESGFTSELKLKGLTTFLTAVNALLLKEK